MPLPIITDVFRAAVLGHTAAGHHWANVLHFRKTGVLTFDGAIAVLDPKLLAAYNTNLGTGNCILGHMPATAGLDQISYTPLDGTSATTVIAHAVAGTNAGEQLPASVALVVTLRTAFRGRAHRGRVYQGPFVESDNAAGGVPVSTLPGLFANQWTQFLSNLSGSGVSLVVASYKTTSAQDVTTCTCDARWDTQRRRLNT